MSCAKLTNDDIGPVIGYTNIEPDTVATVLPFTTGVNWVIDSIAIDLDRDGSSDVIFQVHHYRDMICHSGYNYGRIFSPHCVVSLADTFYTDSMHFVSIPADYYIEPKELYFTETYHTGYTHARSECGYISNKLDSNKSYFLLTKLKKGSDIYYGWIQFKPNYTVMDYAINNVPNMRINPGQK